MSFGRSLGELWARERVVWYTWYVSILLTSSASKSYTVTSLRIPVGQTIPPSFIPSLFCFAVLTLPHRYDSSCWWNVHPGIDQWPADASITSFHPRCSFLPSPIRFAIIRPRTGVSSSGDLVQAMRRGAFGATESFVRWCMGGGERTTAAPPTSQHALVNNEGRSNYACCEAGYVESAPSIHSARRFAR